MRGLRIHIQASWLRTVVSRRSPCVWGSILRRYSTSKVFYQSLENLVDVALRRGTVNKNLLKEVVNDRVTYQSKILLKDLIDDSNYVLFVYLLQIDQPHTAAKILFNEIKALERNNKDVKALKLIDSDAMKHIIESLSIKRNFERDITDFKVIFSLINQYRNLNKAPLVNRYKISHEDIKRIIDKAHSFHIQSLDEDVTNIPRIPTLEYLTSELGKLISVIVSDTLSFYKPVEKNGDSYTNVIYLDEVLDRQLLFKYLHFTYTIIQSAAVKNDSITIYKIWQLIYPFHTKLYNSSIHSQGNNDINLFFFYDTLSKVISSLSKNRRYSPLIDVLISNLPIDSIKVCPSLMSSLLHHCTRTNNEKLALVLMSQYNETSDSTVDARYTKGQLNALFSASLRSGEFDKSEQILSYLQQSGVKFGPFHFDQLIRCLLKNGKPSGNGLVDSGEMPNLEKRGELAWKMIETYKTINKNALITYLNFMVDQPLVFNKQQVRQIFDLGISMFNSEKHGQWWDKFYLAYFKYMVRNYPLYMAVDVYKRNTAASDSVILKTLAVPASRKYTKQQNPFDINYSKVKMSLSFEVRNIILRDIYQQAYTYLQRAIISESAQLEQAKNQVQAVCPWVFLEMTRLRNGASGKEKEYQTTPNIFSSAAVASDLVKTVRQQARSFGFSLSETTGNSSISKEERMYRNERGERIPIGGSTLKKQFDIALESIHNI